MIQEATGMALGTISDLIKKYKRLGYVKNHSRSGAKRKMTELIDKLSRWWQKNFLSVTKASNLLEKELGIQVSPFTIRNQLKEIAYFQKPIESED